jgi:hypothetical protein
MPTSPSSYPSYYFSDLGRLTSSLSRIPESIFPRESRKIHTACPGSLLRLLSVRQRFVRGDAERIATGRLCDSSSSDSSRSRIFLWLHDRRCRR